ncbi:hypothetical protein BESB_023470, partial [Besnoitia besnoiti]
SRVSLRFLAVRLRRFVAAFPSSSHPSSSRSHRFSSLSFALPAAGRSSLVLSADFPRRSLFHLSSGLHASERPRVVELSNLRRVWPLPASRRVAEAAAKKLFSAFRLDGIGAKAAEVSSFSSRARIVSRLSVFPLPSLREPPVSCGGVLFFLGGSPQWGAVVILCRAVLVALLPSSSVEFVAVAEFSLSVSQRRA